MSVLNYIKGKLKDFTTNKYILPYTLHSNLLNDDGTPYKNIKEITYAEWKAMVDNGTIDELQWYKIVDKNYVVSASSIGFDNSGTRLQSNNVQGAIGELNTKITKLKVNTYVVNTSEFGTVPFEELGISLVSNVAFMTVVDGQGYAFATLNNTDRNVAICKMRNASLTDDTIVHCYNTTVRVTVGIYEIY